MYNTQLYSLGQMNKFQIAYYIVAVMMVMTAIVVLGVASLTGDLYSALCTFWLPIVVNGFLLYALKDWRACGDAK